VPAKTVSVGDAGVVVLVVVPVLPPVLPLLSLMLPPPPPPHAAMARHNRHAKKYETADEAAHGWCLSTVRNFMTESMQMPFPKRGVADSRRNAIPRHYTWDYFPLQSHC
jgi:hypothetical protein